MQQLLCLARIGNYMISKQNFQNVKRLPIYVIGIVMALVLVASACSSDDDDTTTEPPNTVTTASTPSTEEPPETTEATTTTMAPPTTTTTTSPETSTTQTPDEAPVSMLDLFTVPDPLPEGEPGEIIAIEDLGTFNDVSGYRILYHSRNRQGENIAVSGFALAPAGEAPEGGWPVVAFAHGTTGIADQCAPSNFAFDELEASSDSATNGMLRDLVELGYVVTATDYEGLGTPGLHPYVVGESAANTVIDSVRAVQNMEEIEASNSWAVTGISQGGHAAIHAGQYWPDYAPELDLVGVVTMAPPSQFSFLYDTLVVSPSRGFIFMATAAFDDAYEEADITDVLTPLGVDLLEELDNGCTEYFFDVINAYDVDELVAVDNPLAVPPWDDIARENDVNQRAVTAPLFIVHGGADELIPAVSSSLLRSQLCAFPDQGPTIRTEYPGASHAGVATASSNDVYEWLGARFAGEEAPDSCG